MQRLEAKDVLIKPTAVEAAFRTKLTTLPMIPGKAINILSANFNNKFAMFLSCSFIHSFMPGSGFGADGVGSGLGVGVGSGLGVGLGVGVGPGGTIDLVAERILFIIIPIAKPKAVITEVIVRPCSRNKV